VRPQIPSGGQRTISDSRRKLILDLAGGDHRTLPLIHSLEPIKSRDSIYRWLISNDITGEKLYSFFQERGFSWNRVATDVISRIEKSDKKPLIMGRDVL